MYLGTEGLRDEKIVHRSSFIVLRFPDHRSLITISVGVGLVFLLLNFQKFYIVDNYRPCWNLFFISQEPMRKMWR